MEGRIRSTIRRTRYGEQEMNWKGQLKKQEEPEPQFVDPENQEDELEKNEMQQLQGDTRMINELKGKQNTLQQYIQQSQQLYNELKQIDLNTQRQEYLNKIEEINNHNKQKSQFIESLSQMAK